MRDEIRLTFAVGLFFIDLISIICYYNIKSYSSLRGYLFRYGDLPTKMLPHVDNLG